MANPLQLPRVVLRTPAALVARLALSALVLQYVLILQLTRDNVGVVLGTVRFLTYFTILSNIAVMLVACAAAAGQPGFFAQARVRGAVALYIGVTGSIYFFILRHLWQPQGAQWWADTGLHYAVPLAYWAWWLACVPHGTLRWRDVARCGAMWRDGCCSRWAMSSGCSCVARGWASTRIRSSTWPSSAGHGSASTPWV